MPTFPDFRLETHFAQWEFSAKHHLTASDAESISLRDLLALASAQEREEFEGMWLGYTETFGAPDLREAIASTYDQQDAQNVLCFAGASEGIFAAQQCILDCDSHAIVITPNYQSHETLPMAICEATGVPLIEDEDWALDIERIAESIRPNTKIVNINFPHNPTGAIPNRERFDALVELCRKHGLWLFADEIFNGLGAAGSEFLPAVADVYERGLSLGVMSKSYGLPGLRIGWIACQDREILQQMERLKHYLSICNSGPSERLAKIALNHRDKLLARNNALIDQNLVKWQNFFAQHPDLFEFTPPQGSCMAYPRYLGAEGVDAFCQRAVEDAGVLMLPSSIYSSALSSTPTDRFRIGLGRTGLGAGLEALHAHIMRNKL